MQKRNSRSPEFKKRVALEAIREDETVNEIAQKYGVHAVQVHKWKKELLDNAALVFEKREKKRRFSRKRSCAS